MVADSCFAGARSAGFEEPLLRQPGDEPRARSCATSPPALSRWCWPPAATARCSTSGGSGHSILAKALFDALESQQEPLEISALFRRIQPAIQARSALLGLQQDPVLTPMAFLAATKAAS